MLCRKCQTVFQSVCTILHVVAQLVMKPLAMQETRVQSLEKEIATHSSILAGEIPWTEEPGGLQSMVSQDLDMTERLNCHQEMCKDYSLLSYSSLPVILCLFDYGHPVAVSV